MLSLSNTRSRIVWETCAPLRDLYFLALNLSHCDPTVLLVRQLHSGVSLSTQEPRDTLECILRPTVHLPSSRGFLQQRQQQVAAAGAQAATGACWLFFGCRTSEEDYLYRSDWDAFLAAGTLTRLEVAFSRAQVRALGLGSH